MKGIYFEEKGLALLAQSGITRPDIYEIPVEVIAQDGVGDG